MKALVVVCVCVCVRGSGAVTQLSFEASPQGHRPVKKWPWNHETMRVITYLGAAGGPLMEGLDVKHPSSTSSRNIKELILKIGELWTMLGAPMNSVQLCEFKSLRGIEHKDVTSNKEQEKREICKHGVSRMDRPGSAFPADIKSAVKKATMKKWPLRVIPHRLTTTVTLMQWPQMFLWFMLLFSLGPEAASSQVPDDPTNE